MGLRPELIPAHMRQQLRLIGVGEDQLARVLRNVRSLADWPYAWEAEGDRHASLGDWHEAVASYYLGQRPLITDTALKRRLYGLVLDAYERAAYQPQLEHLRVRTRSGETVAGYLQVPGARSGRPVPAIVMVPGVTATKEELHVFAMPLARRGYAVARIDSPGYGQTTGKLSAGAQYNAAAVVEHLRSDPRIDGARVHLFGMSMGAHMALNSAAACEPASVVVIAPALETHTFLAELPPSNITAISHMMGTQDWEEILGLAHEFSLREGARRITCPVRMFHGGRDRTIPVGQSWQLVDALGGPTALTIFERDHHNCLEHFDEIIVQMLEWLHDPQPAVAAFERARAARPADAPAQMAILDRMRTPLMGLLPRREARGDTGPGAEAGLA